MEALNCAFFVCGSQSLSSVTQFRRWLSSWINSSCPNRSSRFSSLFIINFRTPDFVFGPVRRDISRPLDRLDYIHNFRIFLRARFVGDVSGLSKKRGEPYRPADRSRHSVFCFNFKRHFLHESLGAYKLLAIFILIIGSLLVSFEKSAQHNGLHMGMLLGVFSSLLFAISHVAAKYSYDAYGFYSGFVWTRGFLGVFGILLLLSPSVRKIFY